MGARSHDPTVPRSVLIAAAALLGFTLLIVVAARIGGYGAVPRLGGVPVLTRDLTFENRADGSVTVLDAADDRVLDVLATAQDGFIMGVLRGIDRERGRQDFDTDARLIRLTHWDDGRLTLDDPATGFHAELVSFGPTNAAAFARLLVEGNDPQ